MINPEYVEACATVTIGVGVGGGTGKEGNVRLKSFLTVKPEDLTRFVKSMVEGHGEFINGCRLVYPRKNEAIPIDDNVAAHFLPIIPLLPTPDIIIFPFLQFKIALTAFSNEIFIFCGRRRR